MKRINPSIDNHEILLTMTEADQILAILKVGLRHLTEDYKDKQAVDLMKVEINMVKELTSLLQNKKDAVLNEDRLNDLAQYLYDKICDDIIDNELQEMLKKLDNSTINELFKRFFHPNLKFSLPTTTVSSKFTEEKYGELTIMLYNNSREFILTSLAQMLVEIEEIEQLDSKTVVLFNEILKRFYHPNLKYHLVTEKDLGLDKS